MMTEMAAGIGLKVFTVHQFSRPCPKEESALLSIAALSAFAVSNHELAAEMRPLQFGFEASYF